MNMNISRASSMNNLVEDAIYIRLDEGDNLYDIASVSHLTIDEVKEKVKSKLNIDVKLSGSCTIYELAYLTHFTTFEICKMIEEEI